MKYGFINPQNKNQIESAILRNNPDELLYAVLSAALFSDDPVWAEDVCLWLCNHEQFNVRGNAILGFAHIARTHGRLNAEEVKPLIQAALKDESEYVRGQAESAVDDTTTFLGCKIKRPGAGRI